MWLFLKLSLLKLDVNRIFINFLYWILFEIMQLLKELEQTVSLLQILKGTIFFKPCGLAF